MVRVLVFLHILMLIVVQAQAEPGKPHTTISHEHLYSLPSATDILPVGSADAQTDAILRSFAKRAAGVAGEPKLLFEYFGSHYETAMRTLAEHTGVPLAELKSMIPDKVRIPAPAAPEYNTLSVRDFVNHVAQKTGQPKDALVRSLLEMPHGVRPSSPHISYLAAEKMRIELLESSNPAEFTGIYNRFFKRNPGINFSIDFSVGKNFFAAGQIEKLRDLKALASSNESTVNYFYSIGRRNLLKNKDMQNALSEATTARQSGLLAGYDITGSINEAITPADLAGNPKMEEDFRRNFASLFDQSANEARELRIHAFEGRNDGTFYDALRSELQSLRQSGRKLKVRIGHAAALNEDWVRFLKSVESPELEILVEVNRASNRSLQGRWTDEAVTLLKKHGVPWGWGSDGLGILGERAENINQTLGQLTYEKLHISSDIHLIEPSATGKSYKLLERKKIGISRAHPCIKLLASP